MQVEVAKYPQSLYIESLEGTLTGCTGGTIRFKARVTYRGGATEGVNQLLDWQSSDEAVAIMGVEQVNWASLVGAGTATITATYPGFPEVTTSREITVNDCSGG